MLQGNPSSWQRALAEAISDPAELLALLELPRELLPACREAGRGFALRVPRGYAARMAHGDPDDPLLRQVLPLAAELESADGFTADPVGDLKAMAVPGVLHKYQGRVLLVATGACAVHCRYCFRRHFPYGEANPAPEAWRRALDYITADASITEVILSGGDPLVLPDARLSALAARLAAIPHLRRLRLHTRLPVVLPERVDEALLRWLKETPLQTVIVVHANHPREIDAAARRALAALKDSGPTVLNQAVLLRGVNDNAGVLAALSEALFDAGVLPYYLHLLDKVQGAAHFEVGEAQALELLTALQARLPGYLVPRLVRESPGAPAKVPVSPLNPLS
jgi:EF-P beta-lysylation protein EpmB